MQSLLGSLKDSPYFGQFEGKATPWERKFITVDESLQHLAMGLCDRWRLFTWIEHELLGGWKGDHTLR